MAHIALVVNELWKRLEIMEKTEVTATQIGNILLQLAALEARVMELEFKIMSYGLRVNPYPYTPIITWKTTCE